MKTRTWIFLLALLLAACAVLSVLVLLPGEKAEYAQVYSDGKLLHTLDLSIDREVTVTTKDGTNVITIRDGKVGVTQADCPDKHCMQRGMCDSGLQIVCLPHKLVIQFAGETGVDGVV